MGAFSLIVVINLLNRFFVKCPTFLCANESQMQAVAGRQSRNNSSRQRRPELAKNNWAVVRKAAPSLLVWCLLKNRSDNRMRMRKLKVKRATMTTFQRLRIM